MSPRTPFTTSGSRRAERIAHTPCSASPACHALLRTLHLKPSRSSTSSLALTAELATSPCTAAWLRSNGGKELGAMLLSLLRIAAAASLAEQHLHSTRLLCGAFTRRQARAAARSLGFATAEDGRQPLINLRLQCLEHCNTFFSHRKERAIAAAP